MNWWKEAVFYQVYPRSFKDSNNDGIGDLKGITEKLDYLSWLGIDVVWISPFFKSPMVDFGYDISDYKDVDPIFGNMSDFDKLVEEAHKKKLKVIIDQVYNHTSDRHPWFVESKSSRDNPKADWYIWKDAKADGTPPNNWVSLFSGAKAESAWGWDENRKQYYLHLFGKEQPDLNWQNPDVKREIFESMRFWLEHGVDGFRFDAAAHYYKDPKFRDALTGVQIKKSLFKSVRDVYYWDRFSGRPETLLAVEEIRELLDSYPGEKVSVGEISADMGLCLYLLFTIPGRFNMAFNIDFMEKLSLSAEKVRQLAENVDISFGDRAWPSYVLGNHDNFRIIDRLTEGMKADEDTKKKIDKLAATFLLTLRGTPFIYYGEEIGMENTHIPYDKIVDPWGKALWPKAGRDVCRTPMQWNGDEYAGFSDVEPWLPVNSNKSHVNVEDEMKDQSSVLNYYKTLLKVRKNNLPLRRGKLEFWDAPEGVLFYTRTFFSMRTTMLINFTSYEKEVDIKEKGKVLAGSEKNAGEDMSENVKLLPFESVVIEIL